MGGIKGITPPELQFPVSSKKKIGGGYDPSGVLNVTRKEVKKFLNDKELPSSKINIRKARRKLKRQKKRALPRGKDVSYTQADAPWQIIYGTVKTGGIYSFIHVVEGTKYLHIVLTYACHEVNDVTALFFGDKEVEFTTDEGWAINDYQPNGNNKVFFNKSNNKGTVAQAANAHLVGQLPSEWSSDHKQSNRAHVYLILVYQKLLFAEGMPDIILQVEGKKLYDPRDASTIFSANTALVIADYLTDTNYGMGVSWDDIDITTGVGGLQWAANICDEAVTLDAGGTEPRYETNGILDTGLSPQEVLEEMAASMAGNVVYTNGKWRFYAGSYVTPSITLTENDLMGAPTINKLVSKGDIFNVVRGEFVSIENDYEVTDYPPARNSTYVTGDGGEIFLDMPLALTTSGTMAQRIAKIELEKRRRQVTLDAPWGLKAYQLNIGDTVSVTLDRYGFSAKVFEVVDFNFGFDNAVRPIITLSLNETDSNIYAWDETIDEDALVGASVTNLPDPSSVGDPSGLTLTSGTSELYTRSDGTIFSRLKIAWTAPTDVFVSEDGKIQIQYKKTSEGNWNEAKEVDGDIEFYKILDVEDSVSYDVRIRSKNGIGATGTWLTGSHTVVGKTALPSNVSSISGSVQEYAIRLTWTKVSDLDIDRYEVRRNGTGWSDAVFVGEVKGNNIVDNYQTAGTHTYRVKAIDTSGGYSTAAATTTVSITSPSGVVDLSAITIDNNVLLSWDEATAGAFPVIAYNIYKGLTFGVAVQLGRVDGTFHAFLETIGGTYNYWVTAVDTAGNEGAETGVLAAVLDPPDYILYDDYIPIITDGTFTDCIEYDGEANTILAPCEDSETWADHFVNNGWTDIQDQIDAGYPLFCQPTPATGNWTVDVDYGAILPSSGIKLLWDKVNIASNVDVTAKIEVKEDIGDSYTVYNSATAFVIPFRYARYTLTFDGDDDTACAIISNINAKIDVKKATDGGNALTSAVSGFTTVAFNKDFIDIINIDATAAHPSTGTEYYTIIQYDWATPDVDEFNVKFLDSGGSQVAVSFSWSAEGVVRPPV